MNNGCECGRRRLVVHQGCRHAGLEVRTKERDCEQCGAVFFRQQRGAGTDVARFCSRRCSDDALRDAGAVRRALRAETERLSRLKPCAECGTPFVGKTKMAAYCSSECRSTGTSRKVNAASLVHRQAQRPATARCRHCKDMFTRRRVKHDRNRYCGDECTRKAKNRRKYESDKRRGAVRGAHVTRAKSFSVPYDRSVTSVRVFSRADWLCQICEVETPRELSGTYEPNAPELDHVMPMSAGGGHVWPNVQCACRQCNGEKGARVPTRAERARWASRVVAINPRANDSTNEGITGAKSPPAHAFTNGPVEDFSVCAQETQKVGAFR